MDELTNLMRLIDLNSEVIPEGNYLEMCNSIKIVHETMSRSNSNCESETDVNEEFIMRNIMRDDTFSPVRAPFSTEDRRRNRYYEEEAEEEDLPNADADMEDPPVPEINENVNNLTGEETDIMNYVNAALPYLNVPRGQPLERNEWRNNSISHLIEDAQRRNHNREYDEAELRRLDVRIYETQKCIQKTKTRQRITSTVRKEAVKRRAQELGILRLPRYTIGALLDKGHNVGNEREFYKAYLDDYNDEVVNKLRDLNADLVDFIRDKDSLLQDMNMSNLEV